MEERVYDIFGTDKPLIGMIHLSGDTDSEILRRSIYEMGILQDSGFHGAIIEDFHGNQGHVYDCLKETARKGFDIARGVNLLRNPYKSFEWARDFGARFVQFDSVLGNTLDVERYEKLRAEYSDIVVLGGVGFKYQPATGNSLADDLEEGRARCDVIVTTGEGTGIETPIDKLREYRGILNDFPLFVGAGVTQRNIQEQMQICDGAIIGSGLKNMGNTSSLIQRVLTDKLKEKVDSLRETLKNSK